MPTTMAGYLAQNAAARQTAQSPFNGATAGVLNQYNMGGTKSFNGSLAGLNKTINQQPTMQQQLTNYQNSGPSSFTQTLANFNNGPGRLGNTQEFKPHGAYPSQGGFTGGGATSGQQMNRPMQYRDQSPMASLLGKKLSEFARSPYDGFTPVGAPPDNSNNVNNTFSMPEGGFGSYYTRPLYTGAINMTPDLGGTGSNKNGRPIEALQPADAGLKAQIAQMNKQFKEQNSPRPWTLHPEVWRDQIAWSNARSPENAHTTASIMKQMGVYEQARDLPGRGLMSGQIYPTQLVTGQRLGEAKKADTSNPFKVDMDKFNFSTAEELRGLYAMGMPGAANYGDWTSEWATPSAVTTTNDTVAQQLGNQIGKTGNIFQRDYGKQKSPARTAAPPTMVPTAGATASLYAAKEPTRGGKLARVPKGPAIPQAAPVQQRYALQGGGGAGGGGGTSGSALLDELRKTRTGLMQ